MLINSECGCHLPPLPRWEPGSQGFWYNRHEKMNAEWYSNTFKIFFLKCVDLRQYPSPYFEHFFDFQERWKKALIPKQNLVYWTEFISLRAVRTSSTQLPIGFEIDKKSPKTDFCILFLLASLRWKKAVASWYSLFFFSPSSQLKFWNDLIFLYFPCFSQSQQGH